MRYGVAVLGSTGSIGTSTLEVLAALGEPYRVVALSAGRNVGLLIRQARRFKPDFVTTQDADDARLVQQALGPGVRVGWGEDGLIEAASLPQADTVVTAVVGSVGIAATVAALRLGKRVALANKESLVAAGQVVLGALKDGGGEIIPVDSEHSAVFQCVRGEETSSITRIILTASGGPFRTWSLDQMQEATLAQALQHPTWRMGGKITVDSATLMNKGLEVIEAHWLFGLDYDRIDVLIHPQSIVHSMVEMVDGSVLAQMGAPDMKGPIQYALCYPHRVEIAHARVSLAEVGALTFEPPDLDRFPSLRLAFDAGKTGKTAPAVLNAANEVAVQAFLEGRIPFLKIAQCVEEVLNQHTPHDAQTLDAVLAADRWARQQARASLGVEHVV